VRDICLFEDDQSKLEFSQQHSRPPHAVISVWKGYWSAFRIRRRPRTFSDQRTFSAMGPRATAELLPVTAQQLVSLDEPGEFLDDVTFDCFLSRAISGGVVRRLRSETQAEEGAF
jgi:hypothetical protein